MKIPPKSLYTPTPNDSAGPKCEDKEAKKEDDEPNSVRGEEGWPYRVEITLEKLDIEDRKWLLFQLVLCQPSLLDEVALGFPMSMIPVGDEAENDQGRRCASSEENIGNENEVKKEGGSFQRLRVSSDDVTTAVMEVNGQGKRGVDTGGDPSYGRTPGIGHHHSLPIIVPSSEWLLTYCQIDAIPSETRDDFLLNLFLMSFSHALILFEFQSSLGSGKEIQEAYDTHGHILHGQARKKWIKSFKKANRSRKALARVAMVEEYGGVRYWEELGRGREGVWDVALSEIGGWLMRDLPDQDEAIPVPIPSQADSHTPVPVSGQGISDERDRVQHAPLHHGGEGSIAQQHIEMMGFIVETKILSLTRKITRPDSASDSWTGQHRYRALTISDLVKLSVLVTRSPIPLRRLLVRVVESISAEIVVLFSDIKGVEREWVRCDGDLGWNIECVQQGLDEVELGYLWNGVVATWSQH